LIKKTETKKKVTSVPAKKSSLFPEPAAATDSTIVNTAEELERKKAVAKQDKNLLDEASNAQWQKL